MAKNILMFLSMGFEDLEAVTFIDVFGWTKLRDSTESIDLKICAFHDEVIGRFGIKLKADLNLNDCELLADEFDAFVLPGGFHSHGFDEAYSEELYKIATEFNNQNKPIASLCVGAIPLADAGLLENKKATTYNLSLYHDNVDRLKSGKAIYTADKIVVDNKIISCSGPASSLEVTYKLIELVSGSDNLNEVKKLMIA